MINLKEDEKKENAIVNQVEKKKEFKQQRKRNFRSIEKFCNRLEKSKEA